MLQHGHHLCMYRTVVSRVRCQHLNPYDHSKVLRRRRQVHGRVRYMPNLSIPLGTVGHQAFTKYFSGTILGLTCIACRSLKTAVPRCSGATVPRCHSISFTSPFTSHLSPPGWSGFQGLLGNRLWLPSSLTSGTFPHQVNLPPSHIVHVFRVTFLLQPPALARKILKKIKLLKRVWFFS